MKPRVYILILNWNNWPDTMECLESLFRLNYPDYRVVLIDNASTDGSEDNAKVWAEKRTWTGGKYDP